jgi:hypothetical protein
MFWPRMKLSPAEEKNGACKYYDHEKGKRGVLRKIYAGQLMLTDTIRQPVFNFQIARRCRVFGMTASGDIAQFKIQLQDSSGEQYLAQPITLAALLGGYAEIPPPAYGSGTLGNMGGWPPTVTAPGTNTLGWQFPFGTPRTNAPLIFEPNIVLESNQVLSLTGYPLTDYDSVNYRVDFCFHVWEFPSWIGGPA